MLPILARLLTYKSSSLLEMAQAMFDDHPIELYLRGQLSAPMDSHELPTLVQSLARYQN